MPEQIFSVKNKTTSNIYIYIYIKKQQISYGSVSIVDFVDLSSRLAAAPATAVLTDWQIQAETRSVLSQNLFGQVNLQ